MNPRETFFMEQALDLARQAYAKGEVPVGAVLVLDNTIIGRGFNSVITTSDPTAHAEILALREAGRNIGNYRLVNTELFITLEPCTMCYAALINARIKSLCYGALEYKTGIFTTGSFDQIKKIFNHDISIHEKSGIIGSASTELLQSFFKERRGAGAVERDGLENR